jgi:hypothetical protein
MESGYGKISSGYFLFGCNNRSYIRLVIMSAIMALKFQMAANLSRILSARGLNGDCGKELNSGLSCGIHLYRL